MTKEEFADFKDKYGTLIENIDMERIGKANAIMSAIAPLIQELACVLAVTQLNTKATFSVFIIMYSVVIRLAYFL
jgi:hypothetical protein